MSAIATLETTRPFGELACGVSYVYRGSVSFAEEVQDTRDRRRIASLCVEAISWREAQSVRLVALQPSAGRAAKRRRTNGGSAVAGAEPARGADEAEPDEVEVELCADLGADCYHVELRYPADMRLSHSQLSGLQTIAPMHVPPAAVRVHYRRSVPAPHMVLQFDVRTCGAPVATECCVTYFANPPVQGGIIAAPTTSGPAASTPTRYGAAARQALETQRRANGSGATEVGQARFVDGYEPAIGGGGDGDDGDDALKPFGIPTRYVPLSHTYESEQAVAPADLPVFRRAVLMLKGLASGLGGRPVPRHGAYNMTLDVAHNADERCRYLCMTYVEKDGARAAVNSLEVNFLDLGAVVGAVGAHYVDCDQFFVWRDPERDALNVQVCIFEYGAPRVEDSIRAMYVMPSERAASLGAASRNTAWRIANPVFVSTPEELIVPLEGRVVSRSNGSGAATTAAGADVGHGRKRARPPALADDDIVDYTMDMVADSSLALPMTSAADR